MAAAHPPHEAADGLGQTRAAPTPIAPPLPPLSPLQRLARSRERMRQVLAPPPRAAADASAGNTGKSWDQRLRDIPGLATVIDVVKVWWQQHPLHAVGIVAGEVGRTTLRPVARRHPYALVGVALLAGMLLAWARPWRWAVKSALFAGLLPQVASRLVSNMPIESWLTVLGTFLNGAKAGTPPDAAPPDNTDGVAASAASAATAPL